MNTYQPPNSFSLVPPVIKNLLILNGLAYFAKFVAMATGGGVVAVILNWMALYAPGSPDVVYSIFGRPTDQGGFMPWQLISYAFLHGDMGHLFFNMLALWMFGAEIENTWGSRRFGLFYFACVLGAAAAQCVVNYGSPVPTVGASGGVYGILLAFGMMYPNRPIYLYFFIPIKAKWLVLGYGLLELYSGMTNLNSGVAHFAHLGGMVVGLVMILYWRGKLPIRPQRVMYW